MNDHEVLIKGVSWAIDNGYGSSHDANVCEENGQIGVLLKLDKEQLSWQKNLTQRIGIN